MPQTMKIGLVVDDTLDKPDGVQQYVLLLGEWLAAQGHEVHYLVGQTSRSDIAHIHSLSRNVAVTFNKNKLTIPLPAKRRAIKQLLQTEQFDVLHVQMPYSPFLAGRIIAAAPATTAIIGTFHILPYAALERTATRLLGAILRRNLRRFDKVLAVSQPAAIFAKQAFGVEATVLPNVVNLSALQSTQGPERKTSPITRIVFLGRLVERKGALQLLKAVVGLPADIRSMVEVHIGGKGALLSTLQDYAQAHDLASQVSFDGFITEEAKSSFLHQADIAVFPAMGGESFGIVLLEGMAANAGVVLGGSNPGYASVLAPWPETLFDPQDTATFSSTLQRFISDDAIKTRIHDEQQQAVKQYDVAYVGPQLVDIYQNAVAKRPSKQDNIAK